jgi:hypothetical protein
VRAQPAFQGGDERGHGLRRPQLHQEADRVQGVGHAEFVGGEGRRRAGGARVGQAGQCVRRGGAAGRVAVVEEQDQGLEGAAVPGHAQPEGGQFAGPQGLPGGGQHLREFVVVLGRQQMLVRRRGSRLLP